MCVVSVACSDSKKREIGSYVCIRSIYLNVKEAGESSDVWNVICALISFHRASCPTQMSTPHVATDTFLIMQRPFIYAVPISFSTQTDCFNLTCFKTARLILHLFSHHYYITSLLHPYLHQPHLPFPTPPFFPSPIHCNTDTFIWYSYHLPPTFPVFIHLSLSLFHPPLCNVVGIP